MTSKQSKLLNQNLIYEILFVTIIVFEIALKTLAADTKHKSNFCFVWTLKLNKLFKIICTMLHIVDFTRLLAPVVQNIWKDYQITFQAYQ